MRRISVIIVTILLISCGPQKPAVDKAKPIYEVLTQQSDGGANIRFYEILSESREIKMLMSDPNLKNRIKESDIDSATFLILNMGEKSSGGYSIGVESVVEAADKIVVTVKEKEPTAGEMATMAITYPYAIVKINSKKPVEIK